MESKSSVRRTANRTLHEILQYGGAVQVSFSHDGGEHPIVSVAQRHSYSSISLYSGGSEGFGHAEESGG